MLHQAGVSFDLYYDARKHKIKIMDIHVNPRCMRANWSACPCVEFENGRSFTMYIFFLMKTIGIQHSILR